MARPTSFTFFPTPADLRTWFEAHHATAKELQLGYYKKGTGKPSVTWPESVDEALCFGWIDGVRHSIDEERYTIRFTPRRPNSIWSAVNLKRVPELKKEGRMHPTGLKVYEERNPEKAEIYSYERDRVSFEKTHEDQLKAKPKAWEFYQSLAPSAKKSTIWWVMSAKREETRMKRMNVLIECCEEGLKIPMLRRGKK